MSDKDAVCDSEPKCHGLEPHPLLRRVGNCILTQQAVKQKAQSEGEVMKSLHTAEELLEDVHANGWNPSTREAFLELYGTLVRLNILYHVKRCFGTRYLQRLADYLATLQEGGQHHSSGGVDGEILDIACSTWQDVLVRAWQPQNNLIEQWYRYKEAKEREGEPFREFEPYLKGAVQNTFWGHLRTRKNQLNTSGGFDELEERFEKEESPEELIPVENEVCFYWDQLLRCQRPDPSSIEESLVRFRQEPETVLVWACAQLKRLFYETGKAASLENLLAFMTFFCSQTGRKRNGCTPRNTQELSYGCVAGQQYHWKRDICQTIFQKRIRKDRPMQQLQEVIIHSPYRELVEERTP